MLATGCAPGDGSPAAPSPTGLPTPATPVSAAPTPTSVGTRAADPKLRQELLAMLAADQKDRSDPNAGVGGDQERTERLGEIVDRYGWPTRTLVGEDGATAAWVIAQHSDLDPTFQRRMLGLMREASAAGEADLGDLAYLTDRVAANAGQPQTYGTQGGCGPDGKPSLAPLAEPDRVDRLRAEAGLPTLEAYLGELAEVCAEPQ
jgi:uncharacterized protein DUF6624